MSCKAGFIKSLYYHLRSHLHSTYEVTVKREDKLKIQIKYSCRWEYKAEDIYTKRTHKNILQ